MNTTHDYWEECISIAAEECGAILSKEQIQSIAGAVEGAHENYGMAFYQPESPYPQEIKELKRQLSEEKSKVICPNCNGKGRTITHGPYHSSISPCFKCNGDGLILPRQL